MKKQKDLIYNFEWDTLIVLDACRFDYFKKLYSSYLNGKIIKVKSEGSCTREWLRKTFTEYYKNIIYVSGNPYVNTRDTQRVSFDGPAHFWKVIDGWNEGWNSKLNTVMPSFINKKTRKTRAYYPNKKIISHFMQPHYPYLNQELFDDDFLNQINEKKEGIFSDISSKVGHFVENNIGNEGFKELSYIRYKLKRLFSLSYTRPINVVEEKYGEDVLKKAYSDNIKIVLKEIEKLVGKLPSNEKVVITSDHGELLGEDGLYGHPPWSDSSILKEVPWMEVK